MKTDTAVILAAGEGKRLDRQDRPKPLVEVGNVPLIMWRILQMQEAGVKKIYVVLGHRHDEIKQELIRNPDIEASIEFVLQSDLSSKSMVDAVVSLGGLIDKPFYLSMADLVMEANPYLIFHNHSIQHDFACLISEFPESYERSGALSRVYVDRNVIRSIGPAVEEFSGYEIGIYYISPKGLAQLKDSTLSGAVTDFYDALQYLGTHEQLGAVSLGRNEWFDINTPATHIRAEIFLRNGDNGGTALKKIGKKDKLAVFGSFERQKTLQSNIVIKRGLLKELDRVELIPVRYISSPHFIITDEKVDALYGAQVQKKLIAGGYKIHKFVVPEGEHSKSLDYYEKLADDIFSLGMDKESFIVSLGGGVINNLAGVLASTLYRGIGLIHIPTSMMAQVDAAIDFKQAINATKGKNLLGSYYDAQTIAIDPDVLESLDVRHIRNGIAESIKHALTQDRELLDFLDKNHKKLSDISFLEEVVKRTISLELPLLNGAAQDDYNEMLPQYAHSVGHAIEHLSSYELLHGEALTIAMCVTAEIARLLGICKDATVDVHYDICKKFGLPTIVPGNMTEEDICNTIRYDKHYLKGSPNMALVQEPGSVWSDKGVHGAPIDYEIIRRAIKNNKKKGGV